MQPTNTKIKGLLSRTAQSSAKAKGLNRQLWNLTLITVNGGAQ